MQKINPRLRLQVDEAAKREFERQAKRHGLSQSEFASRLIRWLVDQPPVIQATILNNFAIKLLPPGPRAKARAGGPAEPAAKQLPARRARRNKR